MIPDLVDIGSLWPVLPPGVHDTTLDEIEALLTDTTRRVQLAAGLRAGVDALRKAGCTTVYIDGSFATGKPDPGDYDACWDTVGVDDGKLDPVLLDFSSRRQRQKNKFGGEFFPSGALADGHRTFVEYFQRDKYTAKPKGILRIRLA